MNPINYLIQQLLDYSFSSSEVTTFLTAIYKYMINDKGFATQDLESYFAYTHNDKFIDAFYVFLDDIYDVPVQYYIEWYNSLP